MALRHKATRLLRRPVADWLLWGQAYLGLGLAWLAIRLLSFRRLAGYFGERSSESSAELSPENTQQAKRVYWAIASASRYTIWDSNCFPQAIVGQRLLMRRGIGSTIYLGAAIEKSAEESTMKAHAWLRCGPHFVTGGKGRHQFATVATFATS